MAEKGIRWILIWFEFPEHRTLWQIYSVYAAAPWNTLDWGVQITVTNFHYSLKFSKTETFNHSVCNKTRVERNKTIVTIRKRCLMFSWDWGILFENEKTMLIKSDHATIDSLWISDIAFILYAYNSSSYPVMLYTLGFRIMLSHRVSERFGRNPPCMKVIPLLVRYLDSMKMSQSYINCLCPCTGELHKIRWKPCGRQRKQQLELIITNQTSHKYYNDA